MFSIRQPLTYWSQSYGRHALAIDADAPLEPLLAALPPSVFASHAPFPVRFRAGAPDPRFADALAGRVWERWSRGEQLRVRGRDGSRTIFDPLSRTVTALGPASGTVWFDLSQPLPSWVSAAPALQLFDWWATARDMLATHAAATCFDGSAALLVGASGSGKSTFAVQATERGHGFLGDDYVLLEPGNAPRAHALYRSAKLVRGRGDGLTRFSALCGAGSEDDKDVFVADEALVVHSAPVSVVLAPVIGDASRPVLTLITAAEAVRRAAPSILRQMPGLEAEKFALLSRMMRTLPCYRLDLCRDHGANIDAVAELVASYG